MAKVILFVAFIAVAAGIAFLALSDVSAPTKSVEKPIPTEKFSDR